MLIAICDDEAVFRNELRSYLIEYSKSRRTLVEIFEYSSGDALCASDYAFDMVFLDYQMPGIDGMETARLLRRRTHRCNIVFVTNFPNFMQESFEVNPYRFYIKPIFKDKIFAMLDEYIRQQKMLAPIIVNDYDGQHVIESEKILYIEGDGKYCTIRTETCTLHSSKTLSGVLELLPQFCFYRVHKSYAVNLYCIDTIKNTEVILTNGERALVGRQHIAEFKRTYREFIKHFYLRV